MALGQAVSNKFQIGNAELRVGPMSSANKLSQVKHSLGLLQSATVNFQQDSVDLEGGLPKQLIDTAIVKTNVTISAQCYEYTRRNIGLMLNEPVNLTVGDWEGALVDFSSNSAGNLTTVFSTDSLSGVSLDSYFNGSISSKTRRQGTYPYVNGNSSYSYASAKVGATGATATALNAVDAAIEAAYTTAAAVTVVGGTAQAIKAARTLSYRTSIAAIATTADSAVDTALATLKTYVAGLTSASLTLTDIDGMTVAKWDALATAAVPALKSSYGIIPIAYPSNDSDIVAGTLLVLYSPSNPEFSSVVKVKAKSFYAANGTQNTPNMLLVSVDLTETPFGFNVFPDTKVYIANQVGLGKSTHTNYFACDVVGMEHTTGKPTGFKFWKVAVGGGMEYSFSSDSYAVTPVTFKVLLPSYEDYSDGGSLYHLRNIIPTNPYGMYFSG